MDSTRPSDGGEIRSKGFVKSSPFWGNFLFGTVLRGCAPCRIPCFRRPNSSREDESENSIRAPANCALQSSRRGPR